ncbi:MAG: NADAR family protein [Chloroflexota bacterium]
MKHFRSPRLLLLLLFGATALILAKALATLAASAPAASAKRPNWDDRFDGVVHDAKTIAGFVAEYRWLSNYFSCRVEWDGRVYSSSEAAYHSGKYPAADRDLFTKLDPDRARKLSRAKPYDLEVWNARKVSTMRQVVWAKFKQNAELAEKLLATGDRYLEETNWWGDKIWGVYRGEGQNLLGKILMETRARLARDGAAARPQESKTSLDLGAK